jgi:hypothetical protein
VLVGRVRSREVFRAGVVGGWTQVERQQAVEADPAAAVARSSAVPVPP